MADARRLWTPATEAFVDRAPIDWTALLSKVSTSSDRSLFENLYLLDGVRRRASSRRQHERARPFTFIVGLLAGLAGVQVTCALAVAGTALAYGDAIEGRTHQVFLLFAFAGASVMLGAAGSRDIRSLFLAATFAIVASAFARAALRGLPPLWSAPIDFIFSGLFLEAFAPACLWQFAADFPRVYRFAPFDLLVRRATVCAWGLGLLLFLANVLLTHWPQGDILPAYLWRDHPSAFFWHVLSVALVPAVAAIFVRSRRTRLSERRKVLRLAAAMAVGTAPFLLGGLGRAFVPPIHVWVTGASPSDRMWLDYPIVIGLMATPILSTVAVLADRPFGSHDIFGRAWRSAVVRGLFLVLFVLPFSSLILVSYRVKHHRRLAHALERMRTARATREILTILEDEAKRTTGAVAAWVLTPRPNGAFADDSRRGAALACNGAIAAMLRASGGPVDLSNGGRLRELLPRRDREWAAVNGVELAAAVRQRHCGIAAVVVCGPKRDGGRFDRRDRWLVNALTLGTAAALEANAVHAASRSSHGVDEPDEREPAYECPQCGHVDHTKVSSCQCGSRPILASLPRLACGKFLVVRRLGAGAMGVVYLARDTALGREVALKTLPELGDGAASRLREEARAMASLNHESIATIYGLEFWRGTPVLIVEYLPGGTLAQALSHAPLTTIDAVRLGRTLARALAYMHARGALHRDLKPSNIAFTETGTAKLVDFGLAPVDDPFVGTPQYLPPETRGGASPGPSIDLWALAVVMLEAMLGRRVPRDPAACLGDLPLPLRRFFKGALARQPELRFESAAEFQSALEEIERALSNSHFSGR